MKIYKSHFEPVVDTMFMYVYVLYIMLCTLIHVRNALYIMLVRALYIMLVHFEARRKVDTAGINLFYINVAFSLRKNNIFKLLNYQH